MIMRRCITQKFLDLPEYLTEIGSDPFFGPLFWKKCRLFLLSILALASVIPAGAAVAADSDEGKPLTTDLPTDVIHDPRNDDSAVTVQKGNFVVVPIPLSNPTLGTGLIAGAAYFYAQTEAQKRAQPPSLTGVAAMYTSNESWALGASQQSYWGGDKWRFTGAAGYVDLKLDLRSDGGTVDWNVDGGIAQGNLSRRVGGHWYVGLLARYLDINQSIGEESDVSAGNQDDAIEAAGAGLTVEYDTRDVPTNPYTGRRLEGKAIFSSTKGERSASYQGYSLRFRNYHSLDRRPVVVALDLNGCARAGTIPLWDSCRLNLRGFAATDYLGERSLSGQVEARWRLNPRWGLVGFAGAGEVERSFYGDGNSERVTSYGAGVRFMILKSKRINLRLDYAFSDDDSALYFAVGEAF